MKKIIFALVITMLVCISSFAQMNDWKTIEGLPKQQKIVVETKDGKTLRGKFASATSDKLSLVKSGKTVEVMQGNVKSVYIGRKKKSYLGGVIGGLAGAFVGSAAFHAAAGPDYDGYGGALPTFGGLFGGAILGQKVGAKIKKDYLIYQAP